MDMLVNLLTLPEEPKLPRASAFAVPWLRTSCTLWTG